MSMPPVESSDAMDEFVKAKFEWIGRVQACQKEMGLTSCLKCEKVIGCESRNSYVKAVFFSMSKGEGGDFDF